MKKIRMLIAFILLTSFTLHKYYVSVTEVYYNKEKQTLELIMRAFPDDLEYAIHENYEISADLKDNQTQGLLKQYVAEKFKIAVNGNKVDYQIVKMGMQDEFYTILIQVPVRDSLRNIRIKNTLLQDVYDEQKNIIHFFVTSQKKSFILEKGNAEAGIEL